MKPHRTTSANTASILPRVVVVGGVDPSCGAGVGRDLATATQLSARVTIVGTAWTGQGRHSAHWVEPRDPERVREALSLALAQATGADFAVKIGMVATSDIADAIARALGPDTGRVVYDPVLRASSGGSLYEGDRESIIALARKASLLTPNLAEAAWLLDRPVESESDAREAARALCGLGIRAVLVKGGHLSGEANDVLCTSQGERIFSSPRLSGQSPRGTGCALATAIAVGLARGLVIEDAVAEAKRWLHERIGLAVSVDGERHL